MLFLDLLFVLAAYLMGSIPFGLLVARWFGKIDIRKVGSGNIGATNVGRVMGFRWFVVVFLLDALKGLIPTLAAVLWAGTRLESGLAVHLPILAGLAAICGHMFSCFLHFRGGKGVATALGVIAIVAPWGSLAAGLTFAVTIAIWRMVSLSSILGAIAFGVTQVVLLQPNLFTADRWSLTLFSLLIPALIVWRHRSNIVRLLKGEESRIGASKQQPEEPAAEKA